MQAGEGSSGYILGVAEGLGMDTGTRGAASYQVSSPSALVFPDIEEPNPNRVKLKKRKAREKKRRKRKMPKNWKKKFFQNKGS